METTWDSVFLSIFLCQIGHSIANIPRPRGVAISKAGAYDPTKDFQCLDGSKSIPFDHVNDDYCDCADGTDEPGTSACPNGWFHCTNAGHTPLYLVASRVNDGICDCCDGSDEYEGIITCTNTCKELGKKAREELEKKKILVEEAMIVKVQYVEQGKKAKEEKKVRLTQLETDRLSTESKRTELETKKTEVEGPEKEAKDKHEAAWQVVKGEKEAEKEKLRAVEAFTELDTNNDNILDILEMVAHREFDIDGNGVVSDEEAKEYMEEQDTVDLYHFTEKMWPTIKDIYKPLTEDSPPGTEPPTEQVVAPPTGEIPSPEEVQEEVDDELAPPPEDGYEDDEDYEDEEESEDFRGDNGEPEEVENKEAEPEETMPEYDAETKNLIQVADDARARFTEADEELKNLDKEISDIRSFLELDLGPNDEFHFLREKCFEMTDREYIYKLCPFDKATQRQKNGGSETTLGNWGHWSVGEHDKHSRMKYDRGQHCWNGPDRSVEVILHCGLENLLTSASEPNRCEYQFDFSTPSRCSQKITQSTTHPPHTEL